MAPVLLVYFYHSIQIILYQVRSQDQELLNDPPGLGYRCLFDLIRYFPLICVFPGLKIAPVL